MTTANVGFYVDDGKVFEVVSTGLYEGGVPVTLPARKAGLQWTGAKIPWKLYCEIIAFFRWTYETTKGESQCRIAYNDKLKLWKAIVLPQKKSHGLSTNEIADHPDKAKLVEDMYKEGYEFAGTFHHHCSAGAFQSGTDKNDEQNQTGLHVTIGHVDKPEVAIDSRLVFRAHQYTAKLEEWIAYPDAVALHLDKLPKAVLDGIMLHYVKNPDKSEFPEEWKSRLIEPPPVTVVTTTGYGYTGYGLTGYASRNYGAYGSDYEYEGYTASKYAGVTNASKHAFEAERRLINMGRTSFFEKSEKLTPIFVTAYVELLDLMDRKDMTLEELADFYATMFALQEEKDELLEEEYKKEEAALETKAAIVEDQLELAGGYAD